MEGAPVYRLALQVGMALGPQPLQCHGRPDQVNAFCKALGESERAEKCDKASRPSTWLVHILLTSSRSLSTSPSFLPTDDDSFE